MAPTGFGTGRQMGPFKVELFAKGQSIGWLAQGKDQWCIASRQAAVTIESYVYKGVLYFRNFFDTSRYLSVSDGFNYVGFYGWTDATGWRVTANQLISLYTNQSLSFYSPTDGWIYANGSSSYTPLTANFQPVTPPYGGKLRHVFVLMLENHSFDNIFAFSGIKGIQVATASDSNTFGTPPQSYTVNKPAPASMPTDPGHEFLDVVEQLAGPGYKWQNGQTYPAITNSGYVANYATTRTEIVQPGAPRLPTSAEYGDVMLCFDTRRQLPVIYQLATEFAICDQWFSSLPGPTWPNRFFVHGASSGNWDDSPTTDQIKRFETVSGFTYPRGSIYDALTLHGIKFQLYRDSSGDFLGGVPQVAALKGLHYWDVLPFTRFKDDLKGDYPYPYTFIEPNYGDVYGGSYTGGSSQHPMDGMSRGEALIKATYEALRASPLWPSSLLIITYDEHGGFYDSAKPPHTAWPPGDGGSVPANQHGFKFDQYGPRVPAVVVSPLIARGTIDHTLYDHGSVPATVERAFGMPPLTNRDLHANDVGHLLGLPSPRTDCPTTLANPVPDRPTAEATGGAVPRESPAAVAGQPLPQTGNIQGFLAIMLKIDAELSGDDEAKIEAKRQWVSKIETRGEAAAYAADVQRRADEARAEQAEARSTPSVPT
jgi:phospholipase C